MSDVNSMNKDQLKAYAKDKHGVDLQLNMGIAQLRSQVDNLDKGVAEKEQEQKVAVEQEQPEQGVDASAHQWVRNPASGLAFNVNDPVAKAHPSWPACDKEGKLIG